MIRMERQYDADPHISGNSISMPGISEFRNGTALARNEQYIAVRRPGGKTHHGDGGYSSSYPPGVMVFEILETRTRARNGRDLEAVTVRRLLDWHTGRKKRSPERDGGQGQ